MKIGSVFPCPPVPFLMQILEHYPRAGFLYILLWQQKDDNNDVIIYRQDIKNTFLMSVTRFKNDLLGLVREGLINVKENDDKLFIEMVNWGMEEENLC